MSILIKNSWVVTQNDQRAIFKKDVYVEENRITEISDNISTEADYKIDGNGKILMPGLINTHTHIAMGFMRGVADDVGLDKFLEITFKLDANRSEEDIYHSSLLGMLESLRFGTTTILDLYYSEDLIAKAAKSANIRAVLAWNVLDTEYTTQKGVPLQNAESFIKSIDKDPLIEPTIGLQGVYVCSEETLLKAMDMAKKYNKIIPMHISETRKEVYEFQNKTKKRPVEYLSEIGFLDSNLISVHTVYVTFNEIKMLKSKGVKISHNPISNMKLGNGPFAPVMEFLENGLTVSLGTDSVASNNNLDMFQVMKYSALLQKNERWDASLVNAQQALDFATINGAKALNKEKELGSIEPEKIADLILIDPFLNGLPLHKSNIVSNLVYSIVGMNTDTTIVNGKVLMENKKLNFDLKELEKLLEKSGG